MALLWAFTSVLEGFYFVVYEWKYLDFHVLLCATGKYYIRYDIILVK